MLVGTVNHLGVHQGVLGGEHVRVEFFRRLGDVAVHVVVVHLPGPRRTGRPGVGAPQHDGIQLRLRLLHQREGAPVEGLDGGSLDQIAFLELRHDCVDEFLRGGGLRGVVGFDFGLDVEAHVVVFRHVENLTKLEQAVVFGVLGVREVG